MAKYDIEFKERVVEYYYEYGKVATLTKYNLPSDSTLYRWVRKYESVGFMRKKNKRYKAEEKLNILKYYWESGLVETETKYQINSGTLHVWNKMYEEHGIEGLKYKGKKPKKVNGNKFDDLSMEEKLEYLMLENEYLKKLDALVTEREEKEGKKK